MKMAIEGILRPVVEHPKRGWNVITATFVIGVVFTWPAVEYYFAAAANHRQLIAEVEEGAVTANRLGLYQNQLEKQTEKLRTLEDRALSPEKIERLRNQVTEWVKGSGCQLRRIKLAEAQLRPWFEDDHPLETRVRTEKDNKTPFKLRQQSLNLLITGAMDKVSEFLARLSEQDLLLHTGNLQLRRNTEDPNVVELDLDLILFDLVQGETPQAN
jgi:hypothetical protein